MLDSLLEEAYQLTREGRSFVLATVVWCERPTSAKPGAQALIREDGSLSGWVGGNCTRPVVVREARRLLREGGEPFLLRLGAHEKSVPAENAGVRSFPMTCASGGALDVYMEPHLPKPQLLLVGDSPIVIALQQLASVLDFAVTRVDDANLSAASIDERTRVVIATHGQYDENVLERVLVTPAAYIGLVSSPRRAEACRAYLRAAGLAEQSISRLRAPAGLDLGARTPAEIATSILAELIQLRRHPATKEAGESEITPASESTAIDPVCGMSVEIAGARHTSEHAGQIFYFCCPSCKRQFEKEPRHFLVAKEM
ncbi:MAG TPA: XdhC family protein [Ktedonobacteraceae bacterium]